MPASGGCEEVRAVAPAPPPVRHDACSKPSHSIAPHPLPRADAGEQEEIAKSTASERALRQDASFNGPLAARFPPMHRRTQTRFAGGLVHGTLLERSRQLRKESTPAEMKLWSHLRLKALGGARFRRQHQIEGFLVDFCCLKERLIVELDGSQHEGNLIYDDRADPNPAGARI